MTWRQLLKKLVMSLILCVILGVWILGFYFCGKWELGMWMQIGKALGNRGNVMSGDR
jgi:hypothetical protein